MHLDSVAVHDLYMELRAVLNRDPGDSRVFAPVDP